MNKPVTLEILIFLIIFIVLSGCVQPSGTNKNPLPDITGKNILCVIAPINYNYQEVHDTSTVLKSVHGNISIASFTTNPAQSSTGESITPDVSLQNIILNKYDAVVFIGGPGIIEYLSNTTYLTIAQKALVEGKILAAICIAPCILANAGLLIGKNATVFSGYESTLQTNGAHVVDQPVVQDGTIITANGPSAAEAFGEQIVRVLATYS